jgi:acetyltransferase-like isoleucine patch superfamily enzyme
MKNLSHTIYNLRNKLILLKGRLNKLRAAWWGVQLGKGARFFGKTYFKRYPGTIISIGKKSTFRSNCDSNLIGVNRPCMISTHNSPFKAQISIGNHCGFSGTVIGAFKNIYIGNNVRCGANTLITDSDWHLDDPRSGMPADVVIEDNVWLGVNSIVLKGVTIGANTVIGANSVVTKSIPANVIAAGNPCKVIRTLTPEDKKQEPAIF